MVNGLCEIEIVSDPEELRAAAVDKPFLRLRELSARLPGGTEVPVAVDLTLALAHMIGGAVGRFGLR